MKRLGIWNIGITPPDSHIKTSVPNEGWEDIKRSEDEE
ncbi:MAG: hypothetical protein QG650_800 [Patescibacteria group bacterium]|nr:hypothetical protein [Patescibacteria group bacterium]